MSSIAPEKSPRSLVRVSLAAKIALLSVIAVAVAAGTAFLFWSYHTKTSGDLMMVDIIGRQRMLSMQMVSQAQALGAGRAEARESLREASREFDGVLENLRGEVREAELTPLPAEMETLGEAVFREWESLQPALETLLDAEATPGAIDAAQALVVARGPRLAELSNEMVQGYRSRAETLQQRMWMALLGAVVINFLLLLASLVLTRRNIIAPLRRLERAAVEIQQGDYARRVEVATGDELAVVGQAFNEMALEIKQLIEALRQERALAESLLSHVPAGIGLHRQGRVVFANPELVRLLGLESVDELDGQVMATLLHPDDRSRFEDQLEAAAAGGRGPVRDELRLLLAAGETRTMEVVGLRIDFEGQPAVLTVMRDVTEQKLLNARMMQMDRAIAVGTLVAGVGHEINNPLTYVMGNLSFVLQQLTRVRAGQVANQDELLGEVLEALEESEDGTRRIRDIVSQLRSFGRSREDARAPVTVEKAVETAINMAHGEIRHRARLVRCYEEVSPVEANESQLSQVFLNLLINAAHAIPEGDAEHHQITVTIGQEEGQVFVEVRDTGEGISREALDRIFDPFFTTKPPGQGTGLGLAICQKTINDHGGMVTVDSVVGEGTTMRVSLPCRKVEASVEVPESSPVSPEPRRSLVVIDDEPKVGEALRRIFFRDHDVTVLTRPEEFLETLAAGRQFDLVFCDLMMPTMTGMALYGVLEEDYPEVAERVVFITGGAFTPRAQDFVNAPPRPVVFKPFDAAKLQEIIRNAGPKPCPESAGAPS